jgi:peroxiredoxin
MRLLTVGLLFSALAVLAGCNSETGLPNPPPGQHPVFTQEQLDAHAAKFKDDPKSNRTDTAEKLPLKFVDVNGAEVDLASYRGKSHVVLVIVKGFTNAPAGPFCPGCQAQVNSLTAKYDEFKKRGAEVLMVFPGPTEKLPEFLADAKVDGAGTNPRVPFKLLTDTGLKAIKSLGIDAPIRYAVPATYIIDKNGNIVFAYVADTSGPFSNPTHDRPSVKALLDQLDKLNAQK